MYPSREETLPYSKFCTRIDSDLTKAFQVGAAVKQSRICLLASITGCEWTPFAIPRRYLTKKPGLDFRHNPSLRSFTIKRIAVTAILKHVFDDIKLFRRALTRHDLKAAKKNESFGFGVIGDVLVDGEIPECAKLRKWVSAVEEMLLENCTEKVSIYVRLGDFVKVKTIYDNNIGTRRGAKNISVNERFIIEFIKSLKIDHIRANQSGIASRMFEIFENIESDDWASQDLNGKIKRKISKNTIQEKVMLIWNQANLDEKFKSRHESAG